MTASGSVTHDVMPAERWFKGKGWNPLDFQREVWCAYLDGENGLVHAATGTGKTLAAWWGPLIEYQHEHPTLPSGKRKRSTAPPLRALWITPLRALAADTLHALAVPLRDLGLPWTLEARTGDTKPGMRARQGRRLPTALVTTPESLTLLLTRSDVHEIFTDLRVAVVDEWHELMGTKRGVQVELALARLRTLAPAVRTWGLSATIGNLADARTALLGVDPGRSRIVKGEESRRVIVDSLIPPVIERFPWAGHLGTQMAPQVVAAIEQGATSIVFTNTRSQTEIWYQAILGERPEWAGSIALHHGSLDMKTRDWVEDGMRSGVLRCVVATSSLDLGVDFSPVDRVLQVGSPKGVARILQRAGRSGHRPGEISRVTCVPTNALELLEVAAVRDGIEAGSIEGRLQLERPLDVLAQHIVTVALGGGFVPHELLREVRTTRAYADLTDAEWTWTLQFVGTGGESLGAYPEYARLELENERYVLTIVSRRGDTACPSVPLSATQRSPCNTSAVACSDPWRSRSSRDSSPEIASFLPAPRWSSCACATCAPGCVVRRTPRVPSHDGWAAGCRYPASWRTCCVVDWERPPMASIAAPSWRRSNRCWNSNTSGLPFRMSASCWWSG